MPTVFLQSIKELVRHLITTLGGSTLFDRLRSRTAVRGATLGIASRRERFKAIYEDGLWQHNSADVPPSGEGSSLTATQTVRAQLPIMLQDLGISTLIDLGCGDYTWMRTLSLQQKYVGVDLVPEIVEQNRKSFSDEKHSFFCADVAEDELPDGDAILAREILFHLSFSDIRAVLRNCGRKPRRYLLVTTDSSTLINADIRSGDFRRLNFRCSPFSFPAPDYHLKDDDLEKGRIIGIWRWERVPQF